MILRKSIAIDRYWKHSEFIKNRL